MYIDYEGDKDKVYSTAGRGETFAAIVERRLNRRGVLGGALAAGAMVVTGVASPALAQESTPVASPAAGATPAAESGLTFQAIALTTGDEPLVAAGYTVAPLLRWGEPLFVDAPAFDPMNQSAASQAMQAGYNCDFTGFIPLPFGSGASDHGLLVVNHEYTNPEIMFPGYMIPNPNFGTPVAEGEDDIPELLPSATQAIVETELEAHGLSIVEIMRNAQGVWEIVLDSEYNRRITATTPMMMTGPAAGEDWLKTDADPTGNDIVGTLNNCAGGLTPWGTIVTGEENFHQYFANLSLLPEDSPVRLMHARYGLPMENTERRWEDFIDRFDVAKNENEPFRYGWGVEIDPFDPTSTPKKRSAMGRNKHEGHTSWVSPSGRVAVYSGDDERFDYAYKFVTDGTFDPDNREANLDLLETGTLYVAQFNDDGSGVWLPLIFGEGPLTAENGFANQGQVLINTRGAADLLGATKMDRPEDFETNPVTQKVYLVLTNNTQRGVESGAPTDEANPRPENIFGHIIEITEAGNDAAATTFDWDIFMLCGRPDDESTYFSGFPKDRVSALACPDNITFDPNGNLWISTDGQPGVLEANDGLYAVPVAGADRGFVQQFFSAVTGAEVSGPSFNPDGSALFVSLQHPGEGGTFEHQIIHWPDGGTTPPRPTVVVIQAETPGSPVGRS